MQVREGGMDRKRASTILMTAMVVSLLGTAGIALPYPVLAPYFLDGEPNGLTAFWGIHPKILLGVALAIYPMGILIGSSFVGALSDLFGRRKVLLWTLLGSAIGYVLTGFAVVVESYELFLAARLMTGICEGNIAIARALAAELHPVIERTKAISLVYTTVYAGWLIGPITGGYLMVLGVEVVFYAAAAAVVMCMLVVALAIGRERPQREEARQTLMKTIVRENSFGLLKRPEIRPIFWFYLLYTLGVNTFYELYPMWFVEKLGADSRFIAWNTVTLTASMIVVSTFFAASIVTRLGQQPTLRWMTLSLSLLFLLQPMCDSFTIFPTFVAIGGLIAMGNGVVPAFLSENFGHHGEGRVMGLQMTTFCLTNVIVAVFGSMIAVISTVYALWVGAGLVGLSMLWIMGKSVTPAKEAAAAAAIEVALAERAS